MFKELNDSTKTKVINWHAREKKISAAAIERMPDKSTTDQAMGLVRNKEEFITAMVTELEKYQRKYLHLN